MCIVVHLPLCGRVSVCVRVHVSGHLCLRDELCDLLAGVERCNLHVSHTPVSSARSIQDLVMFLQDFTETSEVQILWTMARKTTVLTYTYQTQNLET